MNLSSNINIDLEKLVKLTHKAGSAIMTVYNSDSFDIEYKDDDSPLTRADMAAHEIIKDGLMTLYPDIPVISEEGKSVPFQERRSWNRFWLVDPLDGTKEFIRRNGEFTVNIALIENNYPIAGVIYAPALETTYFADKSGGAHKQRNGGTPVAIKSNNVCDGGIIAIQSRSHSSTAEADFFSRHTISKFISKGSSLKLCLIADGTADLYFRAGPTWEWDTAAGQAIATIAGGTVIDGDYELRYNKPSLRNDNGFTCAANSRLLRCT